MLHHEHRIPQIPQGFQRTQQFLVIPLVQPYAGLIEHIQDPDEAGANLGGQPYPLGLST